MFCVLRQVSICLATVIFLLVTASVVGAYDFKPEIQDALNQHDTARVLTLVENELKIDPAYAPHYFLKGRIFFARGKFDQALEQFETALQKKPGLYEAQYYRGLTYLELNKLDQAEKDFSEGLKKGKEFEALFHNGMGLLLIKRGDFSKADVEFRKASQVGPDRAEFHANLGDANYYAKIYPLAISEYNQVIQMDTTFLDVYFRLSRAYVAQGQYNDALDQLRTVLTRDSLYAYAWKEAGKLYTMAGLSATDRPTKEQRFKEAIGSYRRFLELSKDSTDGEVFFNLGRSYYSLGGFPQADTAFEYLLTRGEQPASIYLYLGRSKIGGEKYSEGVEYLKKYMSMMQAKDPTWKPGREEADLYGRMGDGFKSTQAFDSAAFYYSKAVELEPENARRIVDAALAYHQLKDYAKALEYYNKRIELGQVPWNIYLNASFCTLNLADYAKAVEYLEKVTQLDSTQVKAVGLLANTYMYQLQDCINGMKWTQKLLQMDPNNCEGLQTLGYAYFAGKGCPTDYAKAINYFQRALDCYKGQGKDNCTNANVMLFIAQAHHMNAAALLDKDNKTEAKAEFKSAFEWYNKVLKCEPGNADAKKGAKDTEFEF
jgi:tetratricopeptide (TPR) repeat protein